MNHTAHSIATGLARLGQWSWLALCALLPISGQVIAIPLLLTVVICIAITYQQRPRVRLMALWPVFLFYALHVVGMAWTTDIDFGLFDLQIKLGLVLLPVAGMVLATVIPQLLHRSMVVFSLGGMVAIVLGLWKAWMCFRLEGSGSCFSQSMLSFEVHPSYAAWYGCWVVAYWGHQLISGSVEQGRMRVLAFSAVFVFAAFIMLLASKSGVIGLALVAVYLVFAVFLHFRGRQRWVSLAVALGAITIAMLSMGGLVRDRMALAMEAFTSNGSNTAQVVDSSEGSALRMVAWTCSLDRLEMEPFGAGTGDIKHALMGCYVEKGATEAAKRHLNSHSQILQGAVALGWPGLIACVLLVLAPLMSAWKGRNWMLALFMLLFLVNALVESVLEVQAGVLFFALFLGLLFQERSSRADPDRSKILQPHDPL